MTQKKPTALEISGAVSAFLKLQKIIEEKICWYRKYCHHSWVTPSHVSIHRTDKIVGIRGFQSHEVCEYCLTPRPPTQGSKK